MSTESTLRPSQGRWTFQGQTLYDFDEVELLIEEQSIVLTVKAKGAIVNKSELLGAGHWMEDF